MCLYVCVRADDGYLYDLFLSLTLCLYIPNRMEYCYLSYTTAVLDPKYQFAEITPLPKIFIFTDQGNHITHDLQVSTHRCSVPHYCFCGFVFTGKDTVTDDYCAAPVIFE